MRQQNVVNVPRGVDAVAAAGALSPGGGHKRCWPPALCALLLLFAVSLLGSKAIAIEVAAQTLSTDTTWTADAGPYQVTGNVTVANGTTLTIAPGTEIQFAANATLNVQGALDAQGTATAPIHFEPLAGESQPWGGITLASYTTESVIRYANISGA
ncbi:MAG TPA: hypothetical protein DIW77_19360, partial [Chromatiaceae bacterium]|nr:hypothetical protein [Chromatiaceae bacterium]